MPYNVDRMSRLKDGWDTEDGLLEVVEKPLLTSSLDFSYTCIIDKHQDQPMRCLQGPFPWSSPEAVGGQEETVCLIRATDRCSSPSMP